MARGNYILLLGASAALFTGCESKAGTGAIIGGIGGAALGAGIGGIPGAAIGAGAGAVGGAVIGAALDASDRNNVEKQNPQTLQRVDRGEQLSVHDIISLHKAQVADEKVINLMKNTDSRYRLNTYQIDRLEKAGVSQRVINYMLST